MAAGAVSKVGVAPALFKLPDPVLAKTAAPAIDVFAGSTPARPSGPLAPVGVSDKTHGHSGFFAYELRDGKIYAKWDPILAPKPFYLSQVEESRSVASDLARVVGPYSFKYERDKQRILVTTKTDLPAKGFITRGGRLTPRTTEPEWHLFDGSGGPKLPKGVRLVEMQVASDIIYARASNGVVYLYKPTDDPPIQWTDALGCPWGTQLKIPDGTDWSMSVSISDALDRSTYQFMNPYTDIISYGETASGAKVQVGITISWATRAPDGHSISMGDTGLNADKQRRFLTPHHGQFYAAAAPVGAGSTWLLRGFEPDGTPALYMRRYDYEIFGACPVLPYTDKVTPFDPNKVYGETERARDVPLESWAKVAFPRLTGKAKITDAMSAHTTGQGNAAREFHIAGTKEIGGVETVGYYYKGVTDLAWRFQATPGQPLRGQVLDLAQKGPTTAKPITFDYPSAKVSGLPVVSAQLLDFHPFQTLDEPSRIAFTLKSGKRVEVLLRTCDAWALFENTRSEDADQVQGIGEDKALVGTLDIPQSLLASTDPEVASLVKKLLPYNRQPNLFSIAADRDHVVARSGDLSLAFERDASGETPYDAWVADPRLVPRAGMSRAELQEVVRRNQALVRTLSVDMAARHDRQSSRLFDNAVVGVLARVFLWLTHTLGVRYIVPNIGAAETLIPRSQEAQIMANWDGDHRQPPAFGRAMAVLNRHLAAATAAARPPPRAQRLTTVRSETAAMAR